MWFRRRREHNDRNVNQEVDELLDFYNDRTSVDEPHGTRVTFAPGILLATSRSTKPSGRSCPVLQLKAASKACCPTTTTRETANSGRQNHPKSRPSGSIRSAGSPARRAPTEWWRIAAPGSGEAASKGSWSFRWWGLTWTVVCGR